MEPRTIATQVSHTTTRAYTLGQTIFDDLWQGFDEASREYDIYRFSQEVRQLGTSWIEVRPILLNPRCGLSDEILRHLHRIVIDTNVILRDLQQTVEQVRDRTVRHDRIPGIRVWRFASYSSSDRERRR